MGFQRYRSEELSVRLPSQRDIAIGKNPNVGEQSIYAKAVWGARRAYHPTIEPENPEIQHVFAHLLKDALRTLIDVVSKLA